MKIIRFVDAEGRECYGEKVDETTARLIEGEILGAHRVTDETRAVAKLLAPIDPRSILCIGLNYRKHAEESGARVPEYPVLFMKAVNALQHPGEPIIIPRVEPEQVDYECELAVVIGKTAKNVSRERALEHVLGYTCANDVSGRDWQLRKGGGQWCRGKTFDTFFPLGPCLVTPEEIPDPNDLAIRTRLNGDALQDSTTSDMIFDVPALISFLSEGTTLLPGTVISTGTPQGVGLARHPPIFLKDGDEVTVEIDGIGALTNPVRQEV
ncbi:MAG: fumarylacetoacetate hydrolase family protein [Planctomycetota bacterium]|nr:fumarylacetoacetate hydrolase family protein [Planctomycetota bacterium]